MSPAAAHGLQRPIRAGLAAAAAIAVAVLVALAVVSTASASTPANVTVSPDSFQSGNAGTTWTFSFDTSGTGALDGGIGDTVTLTFPAGFNVATATATLGPEFGGACVAGATNVTGQDVRLQLGTCTLAASTTGTVTVTNVTAPAAAYNGSDFGVRTAQDTTVANASGSIVLGVSATSVTFTPGSITPADTPVTWTVGFTTSATGDLANPNTVTITFPVGVVLPASPASLQLTGFAGTCGPGGATTGPVSGQTVTLTLPVGCTLAASSAASIDVQGITNPGAGTLAASGFSLSTTTDPVAAHPASGVTIGTTAVSTVTFSGSSLAANNPSTTWTAGFTTSGTGNLANPNTVSITFPAGFVLPASPATVVLNASFLGTCTTTGTVSGQVVTVTVPAGCTLAASTAATIDIQGITNPAAGALANTGFSVSTSEDTDSVNPATGVTITATAVTGVTFSPSSTLAANTPTTWTAGFTTSAGGSLASGNTVTVTFPAGVVLPGVSAAVTLNAPFSGTCLTTGSVSGQAVTITVPAGCTLAASTAATIAIQGITNPAAGALTNTGFSVRTSKDTTDANPAAGVTITSPAPATPTCSTNQVLVGSTCIDRATITAAARVGTTLPIVVTLTGTGFGSGKTVVTATPTGGAAVTCAVSPEPTTSTSVQCTLPAVYASGTFTFAVTVDGVAGVASTVSLTVLLGKPGAPTAFAGKIAGTTATLSWVAPVAAAGSAPVTGYTVTSAPASAGCTNTTALTCTVTGLTGGTAYLFSVVAVAGTLTSDPATVTVKPKAAPFCGVPAAAHPEKNATVTITGTQSISVGDKKLNQKLGFIKNGKSSLPVDSSQVTRSNGVTCLLTEVPEVGGKGVGSAKRTLTVSWTEGYGTIRASTTGGYKVSLKINKVLTAKELKSSWSISRTGGGEATAGALPPGTYTVTQSTVFRGVGTTQTAVQLTAAPQTTATSCTPDDVVEPVANAVFSLRSKANGDVSGTTNGCGLWQTRSLVLAKQTFTASSTSANLTITLRAASGLTSLSCAAGDGVGKVSTKIAAPADSSGFVRLGPAPASGKCTLKVDSGAADGPLLVALTR